MTSAKILIALLILLSAAGCRRDEKKTAFAESSAETSATATGDISVQTPPDINSRIELKPVQSVNSAQTVPAEAMSAEAINKKHNLISEINTPVITPEDFEIGPLLVFRADSESSQEKTYIDFINRFVKELASGNFASDMVYQDSRFFLRQVFEAYIAGNQVPDNIRIGEVIRIHDSLRFNLRLFKGMNRTEGEIIITETDGGLKIKEFYGDLAVLDSLYAAGEKKYEPELYRF